MAKDSFSYREVIYSRRAIERIVRDSDLHSYISCVPQDTFRRYSKRLPGIKGFRKGTSAYLQRALSLCEHAIRAAVATNTKLDTGDQKILSAVWRSWIESAFNEHEQEVLYRNLGKATISKEEEDAVKNILEKKEGISKEVAETIVRLSPLEDCSTIASAIERFPSAREREIQQIVDTLPEQFSQLERRFQVDEERLEAFEVDVKARLAKIQKRYEEVGKFEGECKDLRSATARVVQRLNSVETSYTALAHQIDALTKSKDSIEGAAKECEERLSERLNELRVSIETIQREVQKRDELLVQ